MRYFITHTTPRQYIEKYKSSIAGGNFSLNLKDAGLFDVTYSILPSNIYNYDEDKNIDDIRIVYSTIRSKSKASRLVGCLVEQWRMFRIVKSDSSVWLYNLCVLNFLLFILLKLFKRRTGVYIILADYTPGEGVNNFFLWLTNKADGLISLSNSTLFTVKNKKILPGIVPTDVRYPKIEKPVIRNFQLSGNLKERISSTTMVMEVFSEFPNIQLNISGREPEGTDILFFTEKCENINYYGVLPYEEFNAMLNNNSFVLSMRNPSFPENQCNFPSKVLEALLHNRIIISTIHYPQLDGVKYFVIPYGKDGMRNAFQEIAQKSDEELMKYANQGEYVKQMFSPEIWKRNMDELEKKHGK